MDEFDNNSLKVNKLRNYEPKICERILQGIQWIILLGYKSTSDVYCFHLYTEDYSLSLIPESINNLIIVNKIMHGFVVNVIKMDSNASEHAIDSSMINGVTTIYIRFRYNNEVTF